nr:MAG TPA: nucelotide kinase [Bacteriophage sp.]
MQNERDSNNGMENNSSNSNLGSVCGDMSNIQLCVPPKEQVNHPNHYNQGQYECIAVMESIYGIEATMNFCLLCAFKYTWRTNDKDGIQDIDKAIWYLKKYKELQERSQKK